MNAADFDRQEKQVRNLRATLAVVIAKLRLNKTYEEGNESYFVSKEGLIRYIQSLITQAMEGKDNIEIPEFFYDRASLNNYPLLKQVLSTALTDLQRLNYDKHLTLDSIYRDLMNSLKDLEL
ncbi:hypothetical protein [Xanthocytophaga agilis]|uniref:Uncharacterized protein n=1 Tax=Xanthocytophaga agilis TaxID=3048010 RepID=A0AAE3QZN1_9BACT|nr:hypothetical protein [Xanthocytophaga agilis]MDJ1501014.1 hypothetical protein [Xanthocytophaga agilis]